ncbi:MAG: M20 family metallopeptidase [Rhodospirillales bacterium]|nr:M20 family metallopeptidase [Rhodospirillales bacterium]
MNMHMTQLQSDAETMTGWRRHLHRNPELAFEETQTAAYIARLLAGWGYEVADGVGGTGIVASLTAGDGKRAIGLRADMDALPIQEEGERSYRSATTAKSHMCGHDGHAAMLLGAAKRLSETRNFNGTVRLIFQPAEEVMGGALAMMRDRVFDRFPIDLIFGMHNMPGYELGKFYFTSGPMMAAVDSWEIVLTGKGGHGSMPEKCVDPVVAGASLVMALQTVVARNVAPQDRAVVTVGAFLAGEAGNVIPQTASLRLSIRTSTPETRALVLGKIRAIAAAQAESYGVAHAIREGIPGAVLVNHTDLTARCADIAAAALGEDHVETSGPTFMGSEDFAFFAQERPAVYCIIGNGDTPMVHHPLYDFDDRNLPVGAAYWVAIAEAFLR